MISIFHSSRAFGLAFISAAVLAACGGGGSGSDSAAVAGATGTDATTGTTTSTPATSAGSPTVALSSLPSARTLSTSASIRYESSAGSVYCRLDSYQPIACPNPFVIGATPAEQLSVGTHTVDYYVDTGSGIELINPNDLNLRVGDRVRIEGNRVFRM